MATDRVKLSGGQQQIDEVLGLIIDKNKLWREKEMEKRLSPLKKMTLTDMEDIEYQIGEELDDCYKFFNADHIARWS